MYRSQIGLKVKIRQSGSVLEHIDFWEIESIDAVNGTYISLIQEGTTKKA